MTGSFWDAIYAEPHYVFGTAPNVFLASQKAWLKPGQRALAVADGEGRNGVWLAEHTCDTRGGSSGSPIIAKDGALVGVHYWGTYDGINGRNRSVIPASVMMNSFPPLRFR